MKKFTVILSLCLIIAAICLLPLPVRINTQLHGSYLTDGALYDDITTFFSWKTFMWQM